LGLLFQGENLVSLQKAHEEGLGDFEFRIYSIVEVETGEIIADEKVTINFSVDIIPKFELPEYEGVKVKSAPTEADDKEIDQMIGYILGQRAEFKPVDKVIEKGNYVQCSYTGKIGDTLIEEIAPNEAMYGTQKSTWEEAGAENAPGVPAIVEGLIGMQKDETKEVEMDFPADFIACFFSCQSFDFEICREIHLNFFGFIFLHTN
jgi:trigger factor